MNMKMQFVILSTLFLLIAPCLRAQGVAQYSATVQDTSKAPPDFVNVDQMPKIVSQAIAHYPELAKKAGIEGRVFVKIWVNKKGEPKKAVVLKSDNNIFDQPSVDAAMKYRFSPAIYRDKPVDVWVVIPFTYKLKPGPNQTPSDSSETGKYRRELIDATMRAQSYEEMIKKYDAAMYFERMKEYEKALKLYQDFVKQSKEFPMSPQEMVRHAKLMIEKYLKMQEKQK